ncbi:hypothetical protein TNCV_768631 [Trichonephila clavipes]|nr:hypothetical protein TNCV_768631 [Trichonephila clavipes]
MGAMGRNGPIACFNCPIHTPSASLPYIDQRERSVVLYFIRGVCYSTWTFTPPVPSAEHHCETHKLYVERQKNGRMITGKEHSSGSVIALPFFGSPLSPTLAEMVVERIIFSLENIFTPQKNKRDSHVINS